MIKIQNRGKKRPGVKEVKVICFLCRKEIVTEDSGVIYVKTKRGDEHWIHRECFELNKEKRR